MKKLLIIIVILLVYSLTSCSNSKNVENEKPKTSNLETEKKTGDLEEENNPVYGKWVINGAVLYGAVSTYGKEDIKNIEGRELEFTKEKANCFGDQIGYLDIIMDNPKYETIAIKSSDFYDEYKINLKDIGIESDNIQKIKVSNNQGDSTELIVKNKNTLILIGGGAFIELSKVK